MYRRCRQYLFSNYEFHEYRRVEAIFYSGPKIMFCNYFPNLLLDFWVKFSVGDVKVILMIGPHYGPLVRLSP